MLKAIAAVALVISATAPAQVITSYQTNNPSSPKGDPNKIVCQKEEKIGTRLGGKKVCLTVAEWEAITKDGRDQAERIQSGTPVCGNPDGGCPTGGVWDGPPH
jgi:hypothetical protein